jgi:TRAP-type mannitol/chloroaromatic compound transport system permease small subunit
MIDRIIKSLGERISYLYFALIILIFIDVALRYLFDKSQVWIGELQWHIYAFLFLLGISYTFQQDKHVRVDLFYNGYSDKIKNRIDILGNILLIIPWCTVVMYTAYNYASNSWYIREASSNPGGLPAKYIIKFMIVVAFGLLLITGLTDTVKRVKILLSEK